MEGSGRTSLVCSALPALSPHSHLCPELAKPIGSCGSKLSHKAPADLPSSLIGLSRILCPLLFQSLKLKESHVLTDLGLGQG